MNDAQRHELFVKLNKVSVLIAKNANKIERGKRFNPRRLEGGGGAL